MISDDLLQEIEGEIHANQRRDDKRVHHIIPKVSKTTIHEAVTEKLGYRKLCARWVPKLLTDDHKTKRMGSELKFLMHYTQEGDEVLDSIVTGDVTWVFHHTWAGHSPFALRLYDRTHLAFGGTLDHHCQFKRVSLKQSGFCHYQMSMAHR